MIYGPAVKLVLKLSASISLLNEHVSRVQSLGHDTILDSLQILSTFIELHINLPLNYRVTFSVIFS